MSMGTEKRRHVIRFQMLTRYGGRRAWEPLSWPMYVCGDFLDLQIEFGLRDLQIQIRLEKWSGRQKIVEIRALGTPFVADVVLFVLSFAFSKEPVERRRWLHSAADRR